MKGWKGLFVAFGMVTAVGCQTDSPPASPQHEEEWLAVDGCRLRVSDWSNFHAVVLLFLGCECPISNAYAPEMERLYEEYAPRGTLWLGLHPDEDVTEADARRHAEEYGLRFPIVLDSRREKARAFGATKMPEAVVLDSTGKVIYRGRIDDRYYELGRSRGQPTRHDLRDVLDALLTGQKPPSSRAPAIGCDIDLPLR